MYICYTCILYMVLYMVFFTEGLRSSYRKLAWVGFEPATTEFRSDALTDWTIRSWVQLALRANFVQMLQFHLFFQCSRFISVFVFVSHHICIKRILAQVVTLVAEWIDTYGIHHWRIFRSSYRKLAWVGFEPTTTEFRSDALTDWAIRPWVQFAVRANFVQLLHFHLFVQCSRFISAIALISHHVCFNLSLLEVITWKQRNEWYI